MKGDGIIILARDGMGRGRVVLSCQETGWSWYGNTILRMGRGGASVTIYATRHCMAGRRRWGEAAHL